MISAQFSYPKKESFRKNALTKTKTKKKTYGFWWAEAVWGHGQFWISFLNHHPTININQPFRKLFDAFQAPSCWISLIAPKILFTSFPLRILSSFSWRAEGEAVQGLTKIWLQIMHLIIIQDRRKWPMSFKSVIFTFSAFSVVFSFDSTKVSHRFISESLATSSAPPPRE